MGEPEKTMQTRRSFPGLSGRLAAFAAGGGVLDSFVIEPRWLMLTAPTLRVAGLGAAWEGVRIAHLSDLHAGRICGIEYLRRVAAAANAASPDVIVLTGDHVSRADALTPALIELLAGLSAPEGKFAVLGNHDHACGAEAVCRALEQAGIDVLTNAHRILARRGQPLCIAGVDDCRTGRPDLAAALAGVDERVPRVLLAHNPDYAEAMPARPRVDLMLCGHTHGGQIRLPFGPAPMAAVRHKRYTEGLVRGPRCNVYVSRGIGMVYLPVRFNCRPELPILTLRKA